MSFPVSKTVINAINTAFIATNGITPLVAADKTSDTSLNKLPVIEPLFQKFSNADIRFNTYLIS